MPSAASPVAGRCYLDPMHRRPNILFLLSDEHSFRCLGTRDPEDEGEPVDTPTLDALAASGVSFDRTYCQVPLCTPSRICMLTGVNPMKSGGWDNGSAMNPERPTFASTLRDAGYATCLVGKMHLGGPDQSAGFEHRPYGDLTGHAGHQPDPPVKSGAGLQGLRTRTADAGVTQIPESLLQEQVVARESIAWLREQRVVEPDRPWLLLASFSRPHFPLTAPRRWIDRYPPHAIPEPKVGREGDTADHPMTQGMVKGFKTDEIDHAEMMRARAAYFACVSYLDEVLGDLLATLERDGLLEDTVIVYTSDHGELAGEHGLWWKNSWHEAAARVPLIVSLPGEREASWLHDASSGAGKVVPSPVSLADVHPTLCSLAGATPLADLDGVDLTPAMHGARNWSRGPVWYVNPMPRWGEGTQHVVVVWEEWKYVRFAEGDVPDLLFDLDEDPLEQWNLIDEAGFVAPGEAAEAAARLDAVSQRVWDFEAAAEEASRPSPPSLPRTPGGNNLYRMPDGRLVAAESVLYEPRVVEEPRRTLNAPPPANRP